MNSIPTVVSDNEKKRSIKSREEALNLFISFSLWIGLNPCHSQSFPYLQYIHGMLDSVVSWKVEVPHPNTAAVLAGNLSASAWEVTNIGDLLSPDMIAMYNLLKENLKTVNLNTQKQTTPWLKLCPPDFPPFYYNFLARFASDVSNTAVRANGATTAPDMGTYLSFFQSWEYNGKRQLLKLVFALGDHSVSLALPNGEVHHAHMSTVTSGRGAITSFDIRVGAKVTVFGRPITLGQVADHATLNWLAARTARLIRAQQLFTRELRKYKPVSEVAESLPSASDLHALSRVDARQLMVQVEGLKLKLRELRPDVASRLEQALLREEEAGRSAQAAK